jgi:hypothetical protein
VAFVDDHLIEFHCCVHPPHIALVPAHKNIFKEISKLISILLHSDCLLGTALGLSLLALLLALVAELGAVALGGGRFALLSRLFASGAGLRESHFGNWGLDVRAVVRVHDRLHLRKQWHAFNLLGKLVREKTEGQLNLVCENKASEEKDQIFYSTEYYNFEFLSWLI